MPKVPASSPQRPTETSRMIFAWVDDLVNQEEKKTRNDPTIGFEYKGNPRTSFAAFFAISADSNETKA